MNAPAPPPGRITAFETDRLGSTCVQLRRVAQAGGCMVRAHGRFELAARLAGVEVVDKPPGPYRTALSAEIPPFAPAIARRGPILVSRRSSRGAHEIPVEGLTIDDLSLEDLHRAVLEASVLVGPNSGAAHFAALFGCRTIVYDAWTHHAMLPEGPGHVYCWSPAGLAAHLAAL